MLIVSPKHSNADLAAWQRYERADRAWAQKAAFRRRVESARAVLATFFVGSTSGYVGVSWGKDSVVLAHLATVLDLSQPLAWTVMRPIDNPDCVRVRDAFLAVHPCPYDEIECWWDPVAKGLTSAAGFAEAARRHGSRYASGIRADESSGRTMSARTHGVATETTCRPLLWWRAEDVFAYLTLHDLPVHPAYAMSYGGLLDRRRLRVASIGGSRGIGMGRAEWERRYYPEVLREREAYVATRSRQTLG